VAFGRWAAGVGLAPAQAAARLGIHPRTLARWSAAAEHSRLPAGPRGRPPQRSDRPLRVRALALLGVLGPQTGAAPLQALCPGLGRREVRDLLRRYRRAWRRRRRLLTRTLHWTRPGTVWAIDFAEPPRPLEDTYTRLLAVRDLASGYQLLWLPVPDESAATAAAALAGLFREHGAPLVLKSDNGSAFIAAEVADLLGAWGVGQLFSPPRLPRFNGSCEAGIGSMKTRTHHAAVRQGRPGEWTCDDAEAARLQANETARPWGERGPTPAEVWRGKVAVSAADRAAFLEAVQGRAQEARREQGYPPEGPLDRAARTAVERVALRDVLIATGLLRIV
jgi:transposase InsO family protein